MAIKDSEGNVYKLRGPNKLMKGQKKWDMSKVKFINSIGEMETVEDGHNPIEEFKEEFNVVDIGEKLNLQPNEEATKTVPARRFLEEAAIEEPEPVVEKPVIIEEPKPVIHVTSEIEDILKKRGVEYYCAPVIGKKVHSDDLYDNSYTTMQYGSKFVFDAVVIDMSDLELQFWCVKHIAENSVVHPKTKEKGQRWWRIREVSAKTGGYLCKAITSDVNPDFS